MVGCLNVQIHVEIYLKFKSFISVAKINKEDLTACLPQLLACVEDRNVEVRKSAQDAVLPFMIHLGYDTMNKACSRLKVNATLNSDLHLTFLLIVNCILVTLLMVSAGV